MKIKFNKLMVICLSAILFSSLFISCTSTPETTVPAMTILTDQLGRAVKLASNPQRIISLAPANTEILFALGLGDRVIGVTTYCNYPPEAMEKPKIGDFSAPNLEEVVAMAPDLILASNLHKDKVIPQFEAKGLPIFALSPGTTDEILEAISMVGKITGKDKAAADLVKNMQNRIKTVTDKTSKLPEVQKPRVFYVVWHDPLMTAGSETFIDELIYKTGGINIANDLTDFADISLEAVIAANPEVMVAGVGMGEGEDLPLQFIAKDQRLQDTEARKNNRIYSINMDIIGRPGPRIVDALEQLARIIHPELFK